MKQKAEKKQKIAAPPFERDDAMSHCTDKQKAAIAEVSKIIEENFPSAVLIAEIPGAGGAYINSLGQPEQTNLLFAILVRWREEQIMEAIK